jgi:hypothetical protein
MTKNYREIVGTFCDEIAKKRRQMFIHFSGAFIQWYSSAFCTIHVVIDIINKKSDKKVGMKYLRKTWAWITYHTIRIVIKHSQWHQFNGDNLSWRLLHESETYCDKFW